MKKTMTLNNLPVIMRDNARSYAKGVLTDFLNRLGGGCMWFTTLLILQTAAHATTILSLKWKHHFEVSVSAQWMTLQATDCSVHNLQRFGTLSHIQMLPHHWGCVLHNCIQFSTLFQNHCCYAATCPCTTSIRSKFNSYCCLCKCAGSGEFYIIVLMGWSLLPNTLRPF